MAEGDQAPRRYDLLERVAVGGMAEIFRAKATGAHGFEKILAIKRILPDLASDPEFENRFIAEAKLAVTLTHANVVQIFDFGRFSGSLYIAMEYVDGPDLGRYFKGAIEQAERVPLGAAMHVAMEMCKGLDVAHGRRIVHSDISPSNILLSRMGEVKIADFGIARAATDAAVATEGGNRDNRDNRIMGKWPYMSPEQTRGEPLDARSDLFSAAVVMYELFTSTTLFRGRDVKEIVANVRSMPIPAPSTRRASLPPALDEVLGRALERDPARRYQNASDLLRALLELSYSHTVVATAMDVADTIARWFPPPPPAAAPPPDIDADALIRAELGVVEGPASEKVGSSRLTVRGTTPAMSTDGAAHAPGSEAGATPAPRPKVTFVRGEVGADGVPVWELTVAGDPAVVPPAKPPARARRWLVGAALAGLVVAGVVVARGVGRGEGAPAEAELAVESSPAGAHITLDGRAVEAVTPTTIHIARPTAGEHRLVLQLPGHRPWENAAVALQPGSRAFYRAQLEPLATRLIVHSEPPGADIDLDGRGVGRTPLAGLSVPADGGAHKLRLRHHGFLDETAEVTLVDRQDVVVERKLVPAPRYGTIDLHVEPWALVYLDGRQVGEAPVKGLSLPVGHHRLKLVNPVQHRQTTVAVDVPAKHAYRVRLP